MKIPTVQGNLTYTNYTIQKQKVAILWYSSILYIYGVSTMNLLPKTEDTTPIYQQIVDHVKRLITTGEMPIGSKLPSIRQLARELEVSAITTKRAYEELERENFIRTVPSKGSFVSERDLDQVKEEYLREIEIHMRKIMLLSEFCGLTEQELAMMFHLLRVKDGKAF